MNCLLSRKGSSTKAHATDYFQKRQCHYGFVFGLFSDCSSYVGQGNMILVLVFPCPFRSGSAFVPSQKPSLLAGKSILLRHAVSLKQTELSCAPTHHSHMSQFTDPLLYISNHFRTLGISVICCNWDINHSVQAK